MPQDLTGFDSEMQMYRTAPPPVSLAHLQFLRWLVDHGRLDGPAQGRPSGEFAEATRATPRPARRGARGLD